MSKPKINNSANDYKNIVENMPMPVVLCDFTGKVIYANKQALKLGNVNSKSYHKLNVYDFVSPKYLNTVIARKKHIGKVKKLPPIEIEIRDKKGKTRTLEIRTSQIKYNQQDALQIIAIDVTLSKLIQEQKTKIQLSEEKNKELKKEIDLRTQSEQKLNAIFESGSQLMWTVNKNIALTSFNQNYKKAIYKMYGVYPEINPSLNKPKKKFAPEEHHAFWDEKYSHVFAGKTIDFETRVVTLKGEVSHHIVTLHPVYNHKGQVIEVAGQAKDITQIKQQQQEIINKQSQLEAILNTSGDIVFSVDKKYQIIEFNNVLQAAVKKRHKKNIKRGMYIFDLLPKSHHTKSKQLYNRAFSGESVLEIEKFLVEGKERIYEAYYRPVKIGGEVVGAAVFSKDITDKEAAQQEVLSKQIQLSTIINTTNDIIFSVDKNYRIVQANEVMQEIAFLRTGKYMEPGMNFLDFIPKELRSKLKKTYDAALQGKSVVTIETFYHPKAKIYRTYEATYNPIVSSAKKIVGMSVFSRDITEQKLFEEKMKNTQLQLASIINNSTDIVVSIDRNYNIVQFNTLLANMVKMRDGHKLKEGDSIFVTLDKSVHSDLKNLYDVIFKEGKAKVVVETFGVKEFPRYFETNYNPIKEGGNVVGIAIFSRDITDKITSERTLRATLKEKEVLLKEVHHRVKNNLQVISSILNLQTSYVKDRETANILKECQNRIKTMAFIHESLYQTKDFSHINFSEYITHLVKNLFYSYDANQQKIKANFDIDSIYLNLDTSIPCGLIINELVSNAFKYAFTDGREGFIAVKLKKMTNGKIQMVVADNGKGIPDNVDYKNTESLGLQLVTILTQQINGTITLDKINGTKFEITF